MGWTGKGRLNQVNVGTGPGQHSGDHRLISEYVTLIAPISSLCLSVHSNAYDSSNNMGKLSLITDYQVSMPSTLRSTWINDSPKQSHDGVADSDNDK
jgi:hypothetical protein